jgi:hypothetical protein
MTLNRLAYETEFIAALQRRWARGARDYGDQSFKAPLLETRDQILEEIEDIAGWSFILWCQIKERLDRCIAAEEQQL